MDPLSPFCWGCCWPGSAGSAPAEKEGSADIEVLSGIGVTGGAMLRDLAIVATAFGVRMDEFRRTGVSGILSLLIGVMMSFAVGACVAWEHAWRGPSATATRSA
jgi:hypothetical protein